MEKYLEKLLLQIRCKKVLIMWNFAREILSRFIINYFMRHWNDIMQNRKEKIA